jgi:hypothetical protein
MWKKALWVLVIGMWWKGDFLPSILILTVSFSIFFSNAFCVVDQMHWRRPFRCPFTVSSELGQYWLMIITVSFGHVA